MANYKVLFKLSRRKLMYLCLFFQFFFISLSSLSERENLKKEIESSCPAVEKPLSLPLSLKIYLFYFYFFPFLYWVHIYSFCQMLHFISKCIKK